MVRAGNERKRTAEFAGVFAAQFGLVSHFRLMSGTVLFVMRTLGEGPDAAVLARVIIFEWIRLHKISSALHIVIS
jgi:hypothetical protein